MSRIADEILTRTHDGRRGSSTQNPTRSRHFGFNMKLGSFESTSIQRICTASIRKLVSFTGNAWELVLRCRESGTALKSVIPKGCIALSAHMTVAESEYLPKAPENSISSSCTPFNLSIIFWSRTIHHILTTLVNDKQFVFLNQRDGQYTAA